MSHTKQLIEEALDKLEKYLDEKHLTEDLEIASVKRTGINRYFNKLGIQVVRLRNGSMPKSLPLIILANFPPYSFSNVPTEPPKASTKSIIYLLTRQAKQLLIGTSNTELLMLLLVKKHTNYSHPK